jgi:hypothetical protein
VVLAPGPAPPTPGTFVPQKIAGSRSCPRLEGSHCELPRRTGCQHSWLATWAHLQQRAKRQSAGAQSEEMVYANTFSELPALAEINQRPERLQTVHGRASPKSRHGPFFGRPPAGRRALVRGGTFWRIIRGTFGSVASHQRGITGAVHHLIWTTISAFMKRLRVRPHRGGRLAAPIFSCWEAELSSAHHRVAVVFYVRAVHLSVGGMTHRLTRARSYPSPSKRACHDTLGRQARQEV